MRSLTTRARAERWRRARLLAGAPAPKPQPCPTTAYIEGQARRFVLLLLLTVAACLLAGSFWPDGQTRPLSYSQPEPAQVVASQGFDF